MPDAVRHATRSAALTALEIGQSVLVVVLLALAAASSARTGSWLAPVAAVAAGALFVGGLVVHRRLGARGRVVWVLLVLAAVHGLTLLSPEFSWVAFPVWLAMGQLLPLPLALSVGAVSVTLVVLAQGPTTTAGVVGPLVGAVVALGLSRGVVLIEAEARRSRALLASVLKAQAETDRLSAEVAEAQRLAGVQAERARLAADLHDTLAQGFSSIVMVARAGQKQPDAAGSASALAGIERAALENLAEVRSVVYALAPEDLSGSGLRAPLARLADRLRQTGLEVHLDIDPDLPRLDTGTEVALLRAAQGLLANVETHAAASQVHVSLVAAQDEVRIDVVDDGRGFDPSQVSGEPTLAGGYGLRALRERLGVLGGGLEIESAPGEGTAMSAHLPLSQRVTS